MKKVLYLGLLLSIGLFTGGINSTPAQRQIPTGEEIAKLAKSAKLNPATSNSTEKDGMRATITPVDLSKVKNIKILEKGQVVAVVDIKNVPNLPDGKYNVFLVKLNDGWREFFESGGKILKQVKVEVSFNEPGARKSIQTGIELTLGCFCVSICSGGIHSTGPCIMCPRCE